MLFLVRNDVYVCYVRSRVRSIQKRIGIQVERSNLNFSKLESSSQNRHSFDYYLCETKISNDYILSFFPLFFGIFPLNRVPPTLSSLPLPFEDPSIPPISLKFARHFANRSAVFLLLSLPSSFLATVDRAKEEKKFFPRKFHDLGISDYGAAVIHFVVATINLILPPHLIP